MTFLIQLRTKIRHFIITREEWVVRLLRFAIVLVILLVMNRCFGYQKILNHWWVSVVIAGISMLLPLAGSTFIVIFVGLMHLMTLSTDVAVVALVLLAISYAVSTYFRADDTYNMMVIPACRYLNIPFVVPMEAGLMRSIHELPTIICGSVLSYYLKAVVENASSFLDPNTDLSAAELLQGQILNNSMFYIYLVAMTAMFLVVYTVRTKGIEHAWLVGVLSGVVVEFVLMLAGILFTGEKESIPLLVIGNVVTLIVGLGMVFFARGFDYTRTEHVQFEDDEYYYYVTAVPKMHIPEQEKEIKRITSETLPLPVDDLEETEETQDN